MLCRIFSTEGSAWRIISHLYCEIRILMAECIDTLGKTDICPDWELKQEPWEKRSDGVAGRLGRWRSFHLRGPQGPVLQAWAPSCLGIAKATWERCVSWPAVALCRDQTRLYTPAWHPLAELALGTSYRGVHKALAARHPAGPREGLATPPCIGRAAFCAPTPHPGLPFTACSGKEGS
ncbi:unnamed protein product [Rangifer tarandus platyrhynchus]|uniref:Uncharacterized protein n=2 Tax=Rangifer tarandus platyrhynchus TaxID=3082113 RepID=A0ABN8ZDX9_RANTA|nr:unnamed protein product [Rangifer tarandus platyrhynchus]CAI9707242.1 unnamed protein product [Rangifer tarandus platyrhynchus]